MNQDAGSFGSTQFKCQSCGCEHGEPGAVVAEGWTKMIFIPAAASRLYRWFSQGARIQAVSCRRCGFLHPYVDVKKIEDLTGDGETRCRKCRHILKGLSQPRCPECGETI